MAAATTTLVNIGGSANDHAYRYKMPQLKTKVEGRGKNTRTVILNMSKVAKALQCPPHNVTKALGKSLHTSKPNYDVNTGYSSFKGVFDRAILVKRLDEFIQQFVLCQKCHLPELGERACNSCGWQKPTNRGKRTTSKSARRTRTSGNRVENGAVADEEEVVWHTDASEKALRERKVEAFGSVTKKPKVKQTKKSTETIFEDVFGNVHHPPPSHERVLEQINRHAESLATYACAEPHSFIRRLETFFGRSSLLEKSAALIFERLYTADVLSEADVTAWYHHPAEDVCGETLRKNCQRFVDWLETAEEDS